MNTVTQSETLALSAVAAAAAVSTTAIAGVRISAIVDACFRLIVDGETMLPWRRWGSAQELV